MASTPQDTQWESWIHWFISLAKEWGIISQCEMLNLWPTCCVSVLYWHVCTDMHIHRLHVNVFKCMKMVMYFVCNVFLMGILINQNQIKHTLLICNTVWELFTPSENVSSCPVPLWRIYLLCRIHNGISRAICVIQTRQIDQWLYGM